MKNSLRLAALSFSALLLFACSTDDAFEAQNNEANLKTSLDFCSSNGTTNHQSGHEYRSRVELNYDGTYTGGPPPQLIVHDIEWKGAVTGTIYSFSTYQVQGDPNIQVVLYSSQIGGEVQGEWRVRTSTGGEDPILCQWSPWISYGNGLLLP